MRSYLYDMTDRFIHPQCFTVDGQAPNIVGNIMESEINCGFVVVRNALDEGELFEAQKAATAFCDTLDRTAGWRRYRRGLARNVETSELPMDVDSSLAQSIGHLAARFRNTEVLDEQLLRYNRRSGAGRIGERSHVRRADVSLLGRMTVDIWQGLDRKAVTTLGPGDALIISGGRGMPKFRSWNTTKLVDSDERAQRVGLAFRLKTVSRTR